MKLHFTVNGDDFTRAGETSSKVKKTLNQLGFNPEVVRKVAIAMYEGEINMVIHADGGTIDVDISPKEIVIVMNDVGPGIPDIEMLKQLSNIFNVNVDDILNGEEQLPKKNMKKQSYPI